MRGKRLMVGALGASLLGMTPLAVNATPGGTDEPAAAAPFKSRVVMFKQARRTYKFRQWIVFRAQVQIRRSGSWKGMPPAAAPGDRVKVFRKAKNGKRRVVRNKLLSPGKTGRNGVISFRVRARGNAVYTLRFSGAPSVNVPAARKRRFIRVSRNLGGRGRIIKRRAFYRGDVNPRWRHRRVVIQRKTCRRCRWKFFKRVRTNRKGVYRAYVGAPRNGSWWFRSKVRRTLPRFVAGHGRVIRTYSVRARAVDGSAQLLQKIA